MYEHNNADGGKGRAKARIRERTGMGEVQTEDAGYHGR